MKMWQLLAAIFLFVTSKLAFELAVEVAVKVAKLLALVMLNIA